jgi:hypothetical protein
MSRSHLALFLLAACALAITALPHMAANDPPVQQQAPAVAPAPPISLDDIRQRGIQGRLGHRLGTIITIQGEVVNPTDPPSKLDLGQTLLEVRAVNGILLVKPTIIYFTPFRFSEVQKPSVGTKFEYIGYETGGYSGIVDGEFDYIPAYASTGYSFTTSFLILRDKLKK